MARSKWKGPHLGSENTKTVLQEKKPSSNIVIISRNLEILPKFIGVTYKVHNGKNYSEVAVTENMIGHKFGEFVFTRAKFAFKKNKSKNKS